MGEQDEKKTTEQVEQNTQEATKGIIDEAPTISMEATEEQPTDTPSDEAQEQTEEASDKPEDDKPAKESKTKKKSSKTIGYAAAYIGKGGQPKVLAGSSKRKKDAERKLRESGVSQENMRVTPIKE